MSPWRYGSSNFATSSLFPFKEKQPLLYMPNYLFIILVKFFVYLIYNFYLKFIKNLFCEVGLGFLTFRNRKTFHGIFIF